MQVEARSRSVCRIETNRLHENDKYLEIVVSTPHWCTVPVYERRERPLYSTTEMRYMGSSQIKSGSYPLPIDKPEGLIIGNFRPDSRFSLELNPLAAGFQTSYKKGDTAYCPNDMNRLPNSKSIS